MHVVCTHVHVLRKKNGECIVSCSYQIYPEAIIILTHTVFLLLEKSCNASCHHTHHHHNQVYILEDSLCKKLNIYLIYQLSTMHFFPCKPVFMSWCSLHFFFWLSYHDILFICTIKCINVQYMQCCLLIDSSCGQLTT